MNESMQEAFTLLGVGMITVFLILGLVVLTGQIIINIVNRFHVVPTPIVDVTKKTNANIEQHLAAIITAVDITTKGKGRISKIEKVE